MTTMHQPLPHAVGCAATLALIELQRRASYRRAWITFSHEDGETTLFRQGIRLLSYRGEFTRHQVVNDLTVIVREHRGRVLEHVKAELQRQITLPDGHRVHGEPHAGLNFREECEEVFISTDFMSRAPQPVTAEFRVFFTEPVIRFSMFAGKMFDSKSPLHSDKPFLIGADTDSYDEAIAVWVEAFKQGLAKHQRALAAEHGSPA